MPKMNGAVTRTLVLLKPDAIKRNLAGEIIKRFERKGLTIIAAQMRWIDEKLAAEHYQEHHGNEPYFTQMKDALTAGPLMAIVLEGTSAVQCTRQLIGSQSPLHHSPIGTIRADFAIEAPFNLVHGADSDGSAKREITLWFGAEMYKPGHYPQKKVQPVSPVDIQGYIPISKQALNKLVPPGPPKKKVSAPYVPKPDDLDILKATMLSAIKENQIGTQFMLKAEVEPEPIPFEWFKMVDQTAEKVT